MTSTLTSQLLDLIGRHPNVSIAIFMVVIFASGLLSFIASDWWASRQALKQVRIYRASIEAEIARMRAERHPFGQDQIRSERRAQLNAIQAITQRGSRS